MADFSANIYSVPLLRGVPTSHGARIMQFTEPGSEPGGGADAAPPTVDNFDPAPGTPISRGRSIAFDVKDDVELRKTLIVVEFQGTSTYDVVWDGDGFAPLYASSSRSVIAGGHRYTLRRAGGWPVAPTIRAVAIDTAGNEAT